MYFTSHNKNSDWISDLGTQKVSTETMRLSAVLPTFEFRYHGTLCSLIFQGLELAVGMTKENILSSLLATK